MSIVEYEKTEVKEARQLAPATAADMPVVVAPSGVQRAGSGFLKSAAKITAVIGVGSVLISGIRHGEWTPMAMMAAAESDFANTWNDLSRDKLAETVRKQEEAKETVRVDQNLRQQFMGPLAAIAGLAIVGCMLGQRMGDRSGWTSGACDIGAAGAATLGATH